MPRKEQFMAYKRKSNVGAVVGGITATVLLLGLLGGVAYKSEGFKNWDVKNWFNNINNNAKIISW